MKELTSYNRATQYLTKIFKDCNEHYFSNELETPVITIQSSVGAYGYITTSKVWQTNGVARYELNIGAETLNRNIENVVATMLHEMTHLYCLMHDIKDTSNRGIYHNHRFKDIAENIAHLHIDKHEKYGYTLTSPTDDTISFCLEYGLENIKINRNTYSYSASSIGTNGITATTKRTRRPSSTRKYICPVCGNSFRATKNLNVMCMDCNAQFVLAD